MKEIQDVLDLLRTGTAPTSWGMTEEQWMQHKINKACAKLQQFNDKYSWKNVKDVQPDYVNNEDEMLVLAFVGDIHNYEEGRYTAWFPCEHSLCTFPEDVGFWMPLPEPPEWDAIPDTDETQVNPCEYPCE